MTTYIKLEDVQNHYITMLGNKYDLDGLNDIMELPSINPESMIEEMIKTDWFSVNGVAFINSEKLLQKFKS